MSRKKNTLPREVLELARAKLQGSGLDLDAANALGIQVLDPRGTQALSPDYEALPALLFTYHGIDGAPVATADFHRIRYLTAPGYHGWGAQVRAPRYRQPRGTLNRAYLPTSLPWDTIARDTEIPVVITEGELKAACACARGLPTIGLGGVDVFQASRRGVDALPPLDAISWPARRVYVVFDSDTEAGLKDTVMAAARRLMEWLMLRGAVPALSILPGSASSKVGLDDFLVAHPELAGDALLQEIARLGEVPYSSAMELMGFAARYGYVKSLGRYVEIEPSHCDELQAMDATVFNSVCRFSEITMTRKRVVRVRDVGMVPMPVPVQMPISQALLAFPGSHIYDNVVYRPGAPREVEGCYNLWSGWACEYEGARARAQLPDPATRERVLGRWQWLMDQVYGTDPQAREFAEHWFMSPIHSPGVKHYTTMLVWSPEQGVGKSFVPEMLAKYVYGLQGPGPAHASLISSEQMEGQFNFFHLARSLLVGEEISSDRRDSVYDALKATITSPTLVINRKNLPQFTIENYVNVIILSNHELLVRLDTEDRRAFVHRVSVRPSTEFADGCTELSRMFRSGLAGPTLLWYARERYSMGSFNPQAKAPLTAAKRAMTGISAYPELDWLRDLVDCRRAELTRTIVTAHELDALYRRDNPDAGSQLDRFGRHLSRLGAAQCLGGRLVWVPQGTGRARRRVWSIADHAANLALGVQDVERLMERPLISDKVIPIGAGKQKY